MNVSRLSISVPHEVEDAIRAAAKAAGLPVSVWLARVAQRAAAEQAAIADLQHLASGLHSKLALYTV